MRQIGIFAAAGLYALEHNLPRLAEDHAKTRLMAERFGASAGFEVDLATVQTNILVFRVADGSLDAPTVVARARERGVLLFALDARILRAVTHLDASTE